MENSSLRTLVILIKENPVREVLLGYKKRGYGVGKYTGFGGKVEAGESIIQAAVRETAEETGICVKPEHLIETGKLYFEFPYKPEWTQEVFVYRAMEWKGIAQETSEMIPEWFRVEEVPYEGMWEDGRYWLPPILHGDSVAIKFTFKEDNDSLDAIVYL